LDNARSLVLREGALLFVWCVPLFVWCVPEVMSCPCAVAITRP